MKDGIFTTEIVLKDKLGFNILMKIFVSHEKNEFQSLIKKLKLHLESKETFKYQEHFQKSQHLEEDIEGYRR